VIQLDIVFVGQAITSERVQGMGHGVRGYTVIDEGQQRTPPGGGVAGL